MNATTAIKRPDSVTGGGLSLRQAIAPSSAASWDWTRRLSGRQRILSAAAVAGVLLAVAAVAQGLRLMPYLTVFGLSAAASAVLFLPSGRGVIMVAAALVLNPLAVAILAGLGGALGEITGYALGRSSRGLAKKAAFPRWLSRYTETHMGVTLLVVSIIPNPFVDAMGIVAGRMGYPLRLFLAYSAIGKVVQSIIFVFLALWNLSLLSSVIGV